LVFLLLAVTNDKFFLGFLRTTSLTRFVAIFVSIGADIRYYCEVLVISLSNRNYSRPSNSRKHWCRSVYDGISAIFVLEVINSRSFVFQSNSRPCDGLLGKRSRITGLAVNGVWRKLVNWCLTEQKEGRWH